MERCPKCNRYTGEPKKVSIGDKCEFDMVTKTSRTTRHSVKTGKLFGVRLDGTYTVLYRKNLYRVDTIAHPDDPSPISLALIGLCSCSR